MLLNPGSARMPEAASWHLECAATAAAPSLLRHWPYSCVEPHMTEATPLDRFWFPEYHFQYRRNNMAQEHDPRSSASVRVGRWAAVVLAAGAASASALVVGGAAEASTPGSKVTVVKTSSGKVLSDGGTVYRSEEHTSELQS